MNIEDIKGLIKVIYNMNFGYTDKLTKEQMIIANEVTEGNYHCSSYKLLSLAEHKYMDYHFCVNDIHYEVFVFIDEDIDTGSLLQILFCNGYGQVIKFKQWEYDKRDYIANFKMTDRIMSFRNGEVIIIETKEESRIKREQISV